MRQRKINKINKILIFDINSEYTEGSIEYLYSCNTRNKNKEDKKVVMPPTIPIIELRKISNLKI